MRYRGKEVWILVVLLLCLFGRGEKGFADTTPYFYGPKQRIAVAEVEIVTGEVSGDVAEQIEEMFVTALQETGQFIVVERKALQEILAEQRLGLTGLVDSEAASKVGSLLGAQALIKVVVTDWSVSRVGAQIGPVGIAQKTGRITIDLRIFDTSKGVVHFSRSFSTKVTADWGSFAVGGVSIRFDAKTPLGKAVQGLIGEAVASIVSEMQAIPWQGRVVLVEEEKMYVNAGRNVGLRVGDYLEVFKRGEELKDPDTGLSLGFAKEAVGLLQIYNVEEQFTIARLVTGQAGRKGDIVTYVREEELATVKNRFVSGRTLTEESFGSSDTQKLGQRSIVVIIPEVLIRRAVPRTVPDPAAETEMIRQLTDSGFRVVDQAKVANVRYTEITYSALDEIRQAISLGNRFNADIIVIGEAFAEWATETSGFVSYRARAEARAIDVHTGTIIAADGKEASAADLSEEIAGKKALREAGSSLSEVFIPKLRMWIGGEETRKTNVELWIRNVNFRELFTLENALSRISEVSTVERLSYTDGVAHLALELATTSDVFADQLAAYPFGSFTLEVEHFSPTRIELLVIPQEEVEEGKTSERPSSEETSFFEGKKVWYHREFYPGGELKPVYTYYLDGKGRKIEHGHFTKWYENSQIMIEGTFKDGKKEGIWKEFLRNGVSKTEGNYQEGIKEGLWIFYYPGGQKHFEGLYHNGEKEGEWIEYTGDGRVFAKTLYRQGKKVR